MSSSRMGFVEQSEQQFHITQALAKAQHAIEAVKRTRAGEWGKFVTASDFFSAIREPMYENGLLHSQFVSGGRDGGVFLTTRISCPVAHKEEPRVEWVAATIQLAAVGDVQTQASELTQWRKHHLATLLGVTWANEVEDDDGAAAADGWRQDQDAKALKIFDKANTLLAGEKDPEKREEYFARLRAVAEKGDLPAELLKRLEALHHAD